MKRLKLLAYPVCLMGLCLLSTCPNISSSNSTEKNDISSVETYLYVYGEHCSIVSPSQPIPVEIGGRQSIIATPATDYTFLHWEVSLGSDSVVGALEAPSTTVTCAQGFTLLKAICEKTSSQLQIAVSGGGTVLPGNSVTIPYNTPTLIAAIPEDGYSFSQWTIQSGEAIIEDSTTPTTKITITSNSANISAGFLPKTRHPDGGGVPSEDPLFDPDPVADGYCYPSSTYIAASRPQGYASVFFNHELSYHLNPNRSIIRYEWLFDVDSLEVWQFNAIFNSTPWPSQVGYTGDGKGWWGWNPTASPRYSYINPGIHKAVLRVVDDKIPPRTSLLMLDNIVVLQPSHTPPMNITHGPYILKSGSNLQLSGDQHDDELSFSSEESLTSRWIIPFDGYSEAAPASRVLSKLVLPALNGTVSWEDLSRLLNFTAADYFKPYTIGLETLDAFGNAVFNRTALVIIK